MMAARLKVTQIKSVISEKQNQRDTLRSLGLKRIGDVVDGERMLGGLFGDAGRQAAVRFHQEGKLGAGQHLPQAGESRCLGRQSVGGAIEMQCRSFRSLIALPRHVPRASCAGDPHRGFRQESADIAHHCAQRTKGATFVAKTAEKGKTGEGQTRLADAPPHCRGHRQRGGAAKKGSAALRR